MEALGDILKWATVVVTMPLCWFTTWFVRRKARQRPGNRLLLFLVLAMLASSVIVTVFSVVFVNNDLPFPPLSPAATRVLTRGPMFVIFTGLAVICLWLYRPRRR